MDYTNENLIGAIITDRGHNLLARGIRFFMRLWGRIQKLRTGIDYKEPWGNHARIVINRKYQTQELLICEAVKEGVIVQWQDLATQKDFKVFALKTPLSYDQAIKLREAAEEIRGRKYQIWNFFAWIIYVCSLGIVSLFRREPKSSNKFYCYETVAWLSNKARPGLFDNYEEITSIQDIEENPNYIELR